MLSEKKLESLLTLKEGLICHPNGMDYLGGKLFERKVEGKRCWSFCPTQYVLQAWKKC